MRALYQKSCGMVVFVVAEVVVVGVLGGFGDGLELDEDERQAVDEADEVGAAGVDLAGDPELGDEEEVVVGWGRPSR